MAQAYIKRVNGHTAIEIDGKIWNGATMTIPNTRQYVTRIDGDYYRRLREAGIKLFFVMCDLDFSGKAGYEDFLNQMQVITEAVPDCYVMLRIALHPSAEWVEKHPDAVMKFSDGKPRPAVIAQESGDVACNGGYVVYSREWQKDAGDALIEFIQKTKKEKFASKIVGYFLGAGSCSEWHCINTLGLTEDAPYYECNEDFLLDFQEYLDEKYGKDAKKAVVPDNKGRYYIFNADEQVAFHSPRPSMYKQVYPPVPTNGTGVGSFADINRYQNVVDFYMAWGYAAAKALLYFAQRVKAESPDKLVGAFFGYSNGIHESMNAACLPMVLKSPYVDFCAAPGCYENRKPGGNEPVRSTRDSYDLYGKVFFAEDDTRTHLEPFIDRSSYEVYTEEDSVEIIKRNFAKNLCGLNYSWWYDQQTGGGRYDNEGILATFKKQSEILEKCGEKRWSKKNEIAFVFDLESRMACSDWTSHQPVSVMKNYELGQIGAGYDDYLFDDLDNENMPDYKLYIFACVCDLNDKQREIVRKKLRKNHATALWMYGSGFMNPDGKEKMSCENIKALTGFTTVMECDTVYDGKFRAYGTHEIAENMRRRHDYGGYDKIMFSNQDKYSFNMIPYQSPRFVVEDEEATPVALFCEEGKVAMAVKEYDGFTSVYCGAKYLQYDVLRSVAKFAGCHLYSEDGDVLYVSDNYITVHACAGGTKTLRFEKKCSLWEVYEEKRYSKNSKKAVFEMLEGQTKTFEIKRK